jgi:hypothetical protein
MRARHALDITIASGDEVELWEIDDTRDPRGAEPVVVAEVDYVGRADGYLALTLRPLHGLHPAATKADVIAQAVGRRFIASTETQRRGASASIRSPLSGPIPAVPLG